MADTLAKILIILGTIGALPPLYRLMKIDALEAQECWGGLIAICLLVFFVTTYNLVTGTMP